MPLSLRYAFHQRGMTLAELVVTLGIMSIVAAIAMPAFGRLLELARVRTAVSDLSTDLALARISAISHKRSYILCPSDDGVLCRVDGRWDAGWIGFHGKGSQPVVPASGPSTVRQRRGDSIRIVSGAGRPHVRYLPDGRNAGTNLTINVCARERLAARVVVNNAGRIRSERPRTSLPCPG